MKDAQKKKDLELAEMQKTTLEKTKLADEKLASVTKLEEENTNLKAALAIANKEVSRLKSDKVVLNDKVSELTGKRNDLEAYLGGLAKKLFLMLEGNPLHQTIIFTMTFPFDRCLDSVVMLAEFCQNFEEETSRLEPNLDPINSPVNDEVAMNVFRLESRVAAVTDYLARLKVATSRIDTTLWPRETLQNDLESLMTRLNTIPGRVQEWK